MRKGLVPRKMDQCFFNTCDPSASHDEIHARFSALICEFCEAHFANFPKCLWHVHDWRQQNRSCIIGCSWKNGDKIGMDFFSIRAEDNASWCKSKIFTHAYSRIQEKIIVNKISQIFQNRIYSELLKFVSSTKKIVSENLDKANPQDWRVLQKILQQQIHLGWGTIAGREFCVILMFTMRIWQFKDFFKKPFREKHTEVCGASFLITMTCVFPVLDLALFFSFFRVELGRETIWTSPVFFLLPFGCIIATVTPSSLSWLPMPLTSVTGTLSVPLGKIVIDVSSEGSRLSEIDAITRKVSEVASSAATAPFENLREKHSTQK